jgi:hypothetical protein
MDIPTHEIIRYPKSRLSTHDLGRIGTRKHHVAGLVEVDVTEALNRIRAARHEGRNVSFFAWAVKSIADSITEHGLVHAMRAGKNKVIVFSDVDISILVEKKIQGKRVPLPSLIREANRKTVEAIYHEVKNALGRTVRDERDHVLSRHSNRAWSMRLYYSLPRWMRIQVFNFLLARPFLTKKAMGTAVVTSLESVANFPGWTIPRSIHNLCFALGSVTKKPWVVDDKIVIREILHLTVLVNHDVIDGAPATRFLGKLIDRLESGILPNPLD